MTRNTTEYYKISNYSYKAKPLEQYKIYEATI